MKWSINESDDHKTAVVKDGEDELFRVTKDDAKPGAVEVTFSKDKTISEEAALVAIMSCKYPIRLDSSNLEDMKVIASVAAKVNEGSKDKIAMYLSERAKGIVEAYFKEHPEDRSLAPFQALITLLNTEVASPSAAPSSSDSTSSRQ